MFFRKEPPYVHGARIKTAIVLINLGTPDAPTPKAVRSYLKEFLSDRRVVEIPKIVWWFILNGVILPFRAKQSAEKYASIWTPEGSPLKLYTEKQAALLQATLAARGEDVTVTYAMRYGQPSVQSVLTRLKNEGCDRIVVLPAYPQYSGTTTASVFDAVFAHYARVRNVPQLRFIKHYYAHPAYIEALKQRVLAYWETHGRPDKLVMSFHGVPKRTQMLGDPYYYECQKTARLLAQALGLPESKYLLTFQSRFGRAEWLQPYTAPTLEQFGKAGVKRIDVVCPGFTSDCLETLEEISMEGRDVFLAAGGRAFHYIPCLNDAPATGVALADIVTEYLAGWDTKQRKIAETDKEEIEGAESVAREESSPSN
jgi:ferrochelatase